VLLAAGGVVIWILRAPILSGLARAWIVTETPQKADAIVVLGGGLETRPAAAAELYHQGFAPLVVYTDQEWKPCRMLGCDESAGEITRRLLATQGLPEAAMTVVGQAAGSTWEESMAVREWARTNGVQHLIIVTDIFHTRRCRWLFRKLFRPVGIEVRIIGVKNPRYTATDWWKYEEGLLAFQNEIVKLGYYLLKY